MLEDKVRITFMDAMIEARDRYLAMKGLFCARLLCVSKYV